MIADTMDPVCFILGLLCFTISISLGNNDPTTAGVEPDATNRRESGDGSEVTYLGIQRALSNHSEVKNITVQNGTVKIKLNSSSWEMKLQPRTMFNGNNASFIFYELPVWANAPQILYENGDIQISLPIVTNLVLAISNTASPNLLRFVEENSFSLTINNTKGLKKEDVICAYLVIKNCEASWSSVGCVETVNETSINCNCNKFSTFVVLQKIQSILVLSVSLVLKCKKLCSVEYV
ncbi:uncharacterized protein LOC129714458 [Leucoraja erinacea]|uniref:uncharacterized protein LOC129714458 n=1 Tax=Leucoraja erinaceus TaxID=7782 RepID=UPI00245659C4|nr:uncharacterized protein LOC129714458 [Leucoraja erinacea]